MYRLNLSISRVAVLLTLFDHRNKNSVYNTALSNHEKLEILKRTILNCKQFNIS